MTCKVKQKGKKVKVTCVTPTSSKRHHLRWRLMRGGRTVEQGTSGRHRRVTFGGLDKGRYALHVQGQQRNTAIVVN